jgi:flagellar export protein FliJ
MKRFVFKLDPVLRARRRAEQVHQRVVAGLERERVELEDRLRRQQRLMTEGKQALREGLVGSLRMHELRQQAGSSMALLRSAQRLALELAGVHQRIEVARRELVEAARRRRAIELLRDRRYEQWRVAVEKAEISRMDELAAIAAARKDAD